MFPYLDLSGFRRRSMMPAADVQYLEQDSPGYIAARIAVRSSYINGRLRKRYGNAGGAANSLPLGQTAPVLVAAGTSPPAVSLSGRPTLGSIQLAMSIATPGALGVATIKWTVDGVTFASATTAATVVLGGTGLTANFPAGTYSTDDAYAAATPVPEIVLGWLIAFVTYDCYRRRGANPQDPALTMVIADVDTAMAELKEASDGKDGLFDLPSSEDADSAVTTGFPLGYSEVSPYTWTDIEACQGAAEDVARRR